MARGPDRAQIYAARGQLRLAQGRPADALLDFRACAAMVGPEVWGVEVRDIRYLHVRSGTALALLRLGDRDSARALARAKVEDVRAAGPRRALGIALRVAGPGWRPRGRSIGRSPTPCMSRSRPSKGTWHAATPSWASPAAPSSPMPWGPKKPGCLPHSEDRAGSATVRLVNPPWEAERDPPDHGLRRWGKW